MQHSRSTFVRLVTVGISVLLPLAFCFSPKTAVAEMPTWEDVASQIYLTFEHNATMVVHGDDYAGGIWAFNPSSLEGRRIRQFDAVECAMGYYYVGQDLHLETEGDRLIVQTWPTELLFEAGTWRLIGRRPTRMAGEFLDTTIDVAHLLPETGWALQGPILSPSDLDGTGFAPGVLGIPQCIRRRQTYSRLDFGEGGYECTGLEPLRGDKAIGGEGPLLMWSPASPPNPYDALFIRTLPEDFPDSPNDLNNSIISWDRERHGLWYPVRNEDGTFTFALFPARDGHVLDPESGLDLDLEIAPDHTLDLDLLYYDSNSRTLLGHGIAHSNEDPLDRTALSFLADASELTPFDGHKKSSDVPEVIFDPFSSWTPRFPGFGWNHGCPPSNEFATAAIPVSAISFRRQPSDHQQLVPIIAETEGRHGSRWSTDLWLFNPSEETMTVHLRRLSNDDEKTLMLGPRASRRLPNVLSWVGGGEDGDGATHDALFISAPFRFGRQLRIDGRVWTTDPDTGGSFGHALQAVPAPFGYSNHAQFARGISGELSLMQPQFPRQASFVQLDLRVPGQFRHNLGIVNPYDDELEIGLVWGYYGDLFEGSRDILENHPDTAKVVLSIPPKQVRIFDLEGLFPEEITDYWPATIAILGRRAAPVWFSMIDETTQDATFVPFTNFGLPALHFDDSWMVDDPPIPFLDYGLDYHMVLPAVAHTPGLGGSLWSTTLYGYRSPFSFLAPSVFPLAALHPRPENPCCDPVVHRLPGVPTSDIEPWRQDCEDRGLDYCWPDPFQTIYPDVVRSFSGCENTPQAQGGLEIVTGSWFSGFSRTFTTREDGGTFGGMLPLYPTGGWPIQHFAGIEVSGNTRINLGFFNGDHDHAITHRVSLYDAVGSLVAQREFVLASLDSRQLEIHDFFEGIDLTEATYGLTILPLNGFEADGTPFRGHSWAYASIIDNRTNDPVNLW